MKTIIIPGYSLRNRDWAVETKEALEKEGIKTEVHPWPHWSGGTFYLSQEAKKISSEIGSEKVNIIAKSIGTFIFLGVLLQSPHQLEKIILCGLPLNDLSKKDVKKYDYLTQIPSQKLIILQNENDPHGSFEQIQKLIGEINAEVKVIKKERSDHNYPFFDDFLAFLL